MALAVVVDGGDGPRHLSGKISQTICHEVIYSSYEAVNHSVELILTPIPRKTLTALEPVTLPMDASAYWSCMAATLLAKVSVQREEQKERSQIYAGLSFSN